MLTFRCQTLNSLSKIAIVFVVIYTEILIVKLFFTQRLIFRYTTFSNVFIRQIDEISFSFLYKSMKI